MIISVKKPSTVRCVKINKTLGILDAIVYEFPIPANNKIYTLKYDILTLYKDYMRKGDTVEKYIKITFPYMVSKQNNKLLTSHVFDIMSGNRTMTEVVNWGEKLDFFKYNYYQLFDKIQNEIKAGNNVLPGLHNMFKAYEETPLDKVKVVILGQDPYPTPGHANGLSFSVNPDVNPLPKSLKNIYKELETDLGIKPPLNGDLTFWANQGVLLLNSTLTVIAGKPNSHQDYGWKQLTDETITLISEYNKNVVFILWGNNARSKIHLIKNKKDHLIIESAHPSPLSAHRGFFGSKPFSKTNEYLIKNGLEPIKWA